MLKNSESIKKPDLINKGLDTIINKSTKYGIFIQSIIVKGHQDGEFDELPFPPEILVSLAPLINQALLLTWLGTDFIEVPLKNKINNYLKANSSEISEYELYLCSFLFSDLRFSKHIEIVERTIDKINSKYIAELCFFKVLLYYMLRPKSSSLLPEYERIMIKLLVKARNVKKGQAKKIVEESIRKKKDETENQLKIF